MPAEEISLYLIQVHEIATIEELEQHNLSYPLALVVIHQSMVIDVASLLTLPRGCFVILAAEPDRQILQDDLFYLTYEQPMCADAPIGIFVTAVVDRMGYKYRHPRALRVVYYDVGHLGQTFALVATIYGFGPFQTAAFRDREVEKLLGLDGSMKPFCII